MTLWIIAGQAVIRAATREQVQQLSPFSVDLAEIEVLREQGPEAVILAVEPEAGAPSKESSRSKRKVV